MPVVEVWAGIQPQRLASATAPGPGRSRGTRQQRPKRTTSTSTPGHQASAWRATSGGGAGVHGPCPRSPGQRLACPWWRCARSRAPGERPQHQHRADRRPPGQHLASAQGVPTSTGTSTSAVPPVQQVTAWRARGGGVGVHPTPGQRRATGSPGQPKACPSGGGVGAWCPCIQPQHLASAGQITATSTPAPQHLACPWWRCGRVVPVHPTPAPGERPQHQGRADRGHQATRPAPDVPER